MLRVLALTFVAIASIASVARAEPGQPTPTMKPSVQLETAMPDDDSTVVRPAPPSSKPTPTPSPSPSASPR